MKSLACISLIAILYFPLFSQTQIAGIVNHYAKVTSIDQCEAKIMVSDGSQFEAGNLVLLIQMKGATINSSNNGSFGNIEDIGSAGFYEKNEVISILGNDVYLKYELLRQYNVDGAVQMVAIPTFTDAVVVGTLSAKAWDGETGGILAIQAQNLTLEAPIDLSGLGFRGATKSIVTSDCTFLTNADDYLYNTTNWRGSPKGEGVAHFIPSKEHGRGAQANGGGGGNDHNSGGGGGGNATSGGKGGKQSAPGFGCDGNYPGRGGKATPNEPERIFMGGGGGAGHVDDVGAGSSGGNGGGIAIVMAQTIVGNGFSIISNGIKPTQAFGDGAGGGGGAGTTIVISNTILGDLNIQAKGGDGGNVNNTNDRCNGPGGGGSGGRLLTNQSNFTSIELDGGVAGVNSILNGECNGLSNEAENGENGVQVNLINFPASQNEILATEITDQPDDVVGCLGSQLVLNIQVQGNYLNFQWQVNSGSGWQNVSNSSNYIGATSNSLTIVNLTLSMDGFQYRCLVFGACTSDIYSEVAILSVNGATDASFEVTPLGNNSYQFENTTVGGFSFFWDFGDGNTSTEANPVHTYIMQGLYQVTLTASNACGQATTTQSVYSGSLPVAQFSANTTNGCSPLSVQFQNQTMGDSITGYLWEFPGGVPATSNLQNPTVLYNSPGIFSVQLTVTSPLGNHTTEQIGYITVNFSPEANFDFQLDGLTAFFTNTSFGATDFHWNFGDGDTSQVSNPVHTYDSPGFYDVTLTVANSGCGSAISYQIMLEPSATEEEKSQASIVVFPNPTTTNCTVFCPKTRRINRMLQLLDTNGLIRQSIDFQGERCDLDLTGLVSGVYFLQITLGEKSWVEKLVKL